MLKSEVLLTLPVSKHGVQAVEEASDGREVAWAEPEAMSDAGAHKDLFPEQLRDRDAYADPD